MRKQKVTGSSRTPKNRKKNRLPSAGPRYAPVPGGPSAFPSVPRTPPELRVSNHRPRSLRRRLKPARGRKPHAIAGRRGRGGCGVSSRPVPITRAPQRPAALAQANGAQLGVRPSPEQRWPRAPRRSAPDSRAGSAGLSPILRRTILSRLCV